MTERDERRARLRMHAVAPAEVPFNELEGYRISGLLTADIIAELEASERDRLVSRIALDRYVELEERLALAMHLGRELAERHRCCNCYEPIASARFCTECALS